MSARRIPGWGTAFVLPGTPGPRFCCTLVVNAPNRPDLLRRRGGAWQSVLGWAVSVLPRRRRGAGTAEAVSVRRHGRHDGPGRVTTARAGNDGQAGTGRSGRKRGDGARNRSQGRRKRKPAAWLCATRATCCGPRPASSSRKRFRSKCGKCGIACAGNTPFCGDGTWPGPRPCEPTTAGLCPHGLGPAVGRLLEPPGSFVCLQDQGTPFARCGPSCFKADGDRPTGTQGWCAAVPERIAIVARRTSRPAEHRRYSRQGQPTFRSRPGPTRTEPAGGPPPRSMAQDFRASFGLAMTTALSLRGCPRCAWPLSMRSSASWPSRRSD